MAEGIEGEKMEIKLDGKDQPYIEWEQANGHYKRAWIRRKTTADKDWAGAPRYLNVVRCNAPGHPGGNPTDFPIFNDLPDEQILEAFVQLACAITGRSTKQDSYANTRSAPPT
jgi:hypothetical protein